MKFTHNRLLSLLIIVIFFVSIIIPVTPQSITIDDVFKAEFSTSPSGAYEAQKRYLLIGGHLTLKSPPPVSVNPIKIVPPSVKVGCSGISITSGALSFMNFDQLVSLLQGVVAAAPAVAVRLILSTVCPQCDTIMASVNNLVNQINSMNFDSCQIAQNLMGRMGSLVGLGTGENVSSGSADWQQKIASNINNAAATVSNFISKLQGNCSDESCKSATKSQFTIKPTLLEAVAKRNPSEFSDPNFIKMLRSFIGDLYDVTENEYLVTKYKLPEYNEPMIDIIVLGSVGTTPPNGTTDIKIVTANIDSNGELIDFSTSTIAKRPYIDSLSDALFDIESAVLNNISNINLTFEQKQLINNLPVPILAFITKAAVAERITGAPYTAFADDFIYRSAESLAYIVAYHRLTEALKLIKSAVMEYKVSLYSPPKEAIDNIQDFIKEIDKQMEIAHKRYDDHNKKITEFVQELQMKYNEIQTAIATALYNHNLMASYNWKTR